MGKALKWTGIVAGGIIGVLLLAFIGIQLVANYRLSRTYSVQPQAVAAASGPEAIERGRRWAEVSCTGCHGDNLAGSVIFDDPALGRIEATNLTGGSGGAASTYSEADWVRAIRHGVTPAGRPLVVMPASAFYYFSDQDLADILAYVKSVPPVDGDLGGVNFTPMAKMLLVAGAFGEGVIPAEMIDHTGPRPAAPPAGVTAAYGEYLANVGDCRTCHGPALSGGKDPNPEAPPGPNLTPGGMLNAWTAEDFINTMRTGVTPSGKTLSEFMPWESAGKMTDDQLAALFAYLQSLPASDYTGP